jgi:colicin import membrane protein
LKTASLTAPLPEAQPSILGRPMVILSLILHVVVFVGAVGLPRVLSLGHAPATVYTVDLVTLPGLPAPSPAPAAPAPAAQTPPAATQQKATPPPPPVKKAPAKPIVLPERNPKKPPKPETKTSKPEPKKPEVKKPEPESKDEENNSTEETKTEEKPKQPEHPAATPPQATQQGTGAPQGATGGAGSGTAGTGTGSGDDYDFYIALISRKIKGAWKRPVSTGTETRTAIVRFELSPTGRVLNLELQTPSGFAPLDRSVVQAVHDAEPFPPIPPSLKLDRLKLPIQFELTPGDNGNNSGG